MNSQSGPAASGVFDFQARSIEGEERSLQTYAGQVLLIVNVASQCGFTPQYEGLEALWREYRDRGFAVLGFPCNQFGAQEPGDEAQIRSFCSLRYDVSFPMFAKVRVNGADAHPLYEFLRRSCPGIAGTEFIKWNFTKFLVNREGQPVRRYAPTVAPQHLRPDIEALLSATGAA